MKETSPNCISYAYYALGLHATDEYIEDARPLSDYPELEPTNDASQADAIGFLSKHKVAEFGTKVLLHLAVINPNDRTMATHRPKIGQEIVPISVHDLLENNVRQEEGGVYAVSFLRISK